MKTPVVLLYHIVAPCPADADDEERGLYIHPQIFERQLDDLAQRGYRTVSTNEFATALSTGEVLARSFLLTFDDAYAHIDAVVSPILRRHGFTAVVFACPAHLGRVNTWDAGHRNLARLEVADEHQLTAMARGSWEIGSHGYCHADLRRLAPEQSRAELIEARERLSQLAGKPVVDLAYPYGLDDAAVQADVRAAGYRLAFIDRHTREPGRFHLARRPISGSDSRAVFRMKTSDWSDRIYRLREGTPDWARIAARAALGGRGK